MCSYRVACLTIRHVRTGDVWTLVTFRAHSRRRVAISPISHAPRRNDVPFHDRAEEESHATQLVERAELPALPVGLRVPECARRVSPRTRAAECGSHASADGDIRGRTEGEDPRGGDR